MTASFDIETLQQETERFKAEYIKRVTENLSRLYIPNMSQDKLFQIFLHHIQAVSTVFSYRVYSLHLSEEADDIYHIKVNNRIEIKFIIKDKKEVSHA